MSGSSNGGRAKAYEALRESEELHRATLTNISDAVFVADDEGAFTYICPNVDVIFGYTPDEVQEMGRISRLLGDALFDPQALAEAGEIRNVEREVTARSGERRTVLVHLKRVSIQGGTVLFTCRDVTERKEAERQLAAARRELAHAARLALVGELTTSIVHEMRQPLTSILANAEAGLRLLETAADRPAAEVREILEDIRRATANAADIGDRLRSLARQRPLETRPLDVNRLVGEVLQVVAADARRREVEVRPELDPSMPAVSADRVALQQVVLNLVVNAMEAIEAKGAQGRGGQRQVSVRTTRVDGAAEIAVTDTGPGIDATAAPRIFEMFFTTRKDGVGLGLAIARSIVESHGGRIWAEDEPAGGATFRFTLPAWNAALALDNP
jgi:two-component system sensor kinase FixL